MLLVGQQEQQPVHNKKLSYRRETARQLPTSRGGGLDRQSTLPHLATSMRMVESESHNVYVRPYA